MKNGDYILVKAPEWYRGKRYRGKYCYEHHLVWEKETGMPVVDGMVIHHKNHNKYDNRFKNLEIMDWKDHARMHSKKKKVYCVLKCPVCGKVFEKEKRMCGYGRKLVFCSKRCVGKMYNFQHPWGKDVEKAKKDNVIKEFVRE